MVELLEKSAMKNGSPSSGGSIMNGLNNEHNNSYVYDKILVILTVNKSKNQQE